MTNFKLDLSQGAIIDNDVLCEIFGCAPQGGMRRSLQTNTLVIVSNHVKAVYNDRWIGDTFHYTGMGLSGNQSLTSAQNRTLAESSNNGVDVYLFEVFDERKYLFQGKVFLDSDPYEETQPDASGGDRIVWMFPLKLVESTPLAVTEDTIRKSFKSKEKKARKLGTDELKKRAESAASSGGCRPTTTTSYDRSPWIAEFTKRRADGKCELCEKEAPFLDKHKIPFLESHHIVWLSRGGEDSIENTVALCPNCHRRMHILDSEIDKEKLRSKACSRPAVAKTN